MYLGPFQGQQAGYVDTTIKETRQLHMLIALHVANHALGNQWTALEQEMIHVAVSKLFLSGPVPGFTYRVLPNGSMYPCPHCSGPKLENWVSSEANNIALEALQTVLDPNTL